METFLPFVVASVFLILAPGPDIILTATTSLARGVRPGLALALGFASGNFFHTTLAALGISLLLRQSPLAFNAIKIAGMLYLLWLAFQAFRHRNDPVVEGAAAEKSSLWRLYRTGVLMNILNPKVMVFFLALLPQFVPENAARPWLNMIFLGAIFSALVVVLFSIISLTAGTLFSVLRRKPAVSKALNIATSVVLVLIAASLFFV